MAAKHGVLGISFDHMRMGDLMREVAEHPGAEIAGIFDRAEDRGQRRAFGRDEAYCRAHGMTGAPDLGVVACGTLHRAKSLPV